MFRELKSIFGGKDGRTKLIFLLGAAGVLLILLSELLPQKKAKTDTPGEQISAEADSDTAEYQKALEQQLCDILSQLEGVSNVRVMISISGT
ncbi:MAG: hypothetical protein IJ723_06990, partial [Ruminococcus sp.]|nr:hypothetical protein [Ruminococcus sp.]